MFLKRVLWFLAAISALFLQTASSEAQKQLGKAWQDDQYPRVRTYTNHTDLGPDYAADFYFTERNHSDLYLNGEIPLADGLPGISILSANDGAAYILLYDLTDASGGNFPLIDARRVILGLDPIPQRSFSFYDGAQRKRKIDMEFVVDSSTWRTLYVHLQIDERYFDDIQVKMAVRSAISQFWNNNAPRCNGKYQRVAINLQTNLERGTFIGVSNKWGLASDEHLHLQVFDGASFPPCLGTALNLADANEVTLAEQTILDSNLAVAVPGCDGGTCFYYPAMTRQEFLPNQTVEANAAWDGETSADLRESPGGQVITTLPNGTEGTLLSGPVVASLPDGAYHVWWQCEFAAGWGWVPAEYLIPSAQVPTEILAWGLNNFGQCDAPPDSDFVAVASGTAHGLALKPDRSIIMWGNNSDGQLNIPLPNTNFVAIAGGSGHSLGLKNDGSIRAWGWNEFGQCNVPLPNSDFTAIAAGGAHSLGLKSNGTIIAWGLNSYGQCNVPLPNENFIAIAAGDGHSLGLKTNGTITAWGWNDDGQCNVPTPNSDFAVIAAGMGRHSLGLKNDGTIRAWGWNEDGQCNAPPDANFIAIAAGEFHSLGLKSDGTISAWGASRYNFGQCNVPLPNSNFLAIASGSVHSLSLRALTGVPKTLTPTTTTSHSNLLLTMEPNPTTDFIRARLLSPTVFPIQINVYDISGRLVFNGMFEGDAKTLVIPSQKLGMGKYFCVMKTNNETAKRSFIVLK